MSVKGTVVKINARSVNTRRGPSTSYSVKLAKEDGTEIDNWFSAGFKPPKFKEGDLVRVEYTTNARGYSDITESRVLKEGAGKPASKGASPGAGAAPASRGSGSPQSAHIHYQNSRTAAIQLAELLLTQGALPVTEAKTKAGTAKRFEEIQAIVNKLTVEFFFDVETLRLTKSVADAGAVEEKEEELPDGDEEKDEDESDEDSDDSDDDSDDE